VTKGSGRFGSPLPPCACRHPILRGARAPRSSHFVPRSAELRRSSDPLSRFGLLQGLSFGPPCPHAGAPLLGFRSPSAPSDLPATSPEVPSSGTAHVHGFSPSSRASFRPILPGLVSSRERSWGSPFRGFSSDVAPAAHRRLLPSCRSHGGHRSLGGVPRTALRKGWVDFRVFTSSELVRDGVAG